MPGDPLVIYARRPAWLRRRAVSEFADRLRKEVANDVPFCCRVTGDAELQSLNHQFRGKDMPTDVLSFPGDGVAYLGDLAISADRAEEQAARFGHPPEQEVCVLMLHGLLHLLGHDHETDRGRMRRLETQWRTRLGLPAGLIERTRRA